MRLLALGIVVMLTGCSSINTSVSTLQLNADTVPFPEHYMEDAADLAATKEVKADTLTVSRPQNVAGETAFSPKRWYSCVAGLPARPRPERLPKVEELADALLFGKQQTGAYQAVMFYSGRSSDPAIRFGYDSGLCRDVQYEPIVAHENDV